MHTLREIMYIQDRTYSFKADDCMTEKYKGTTVNERLYLGGFMDQFDEFVRTKNIDGIKNILAKVEITDESSVRSIIEGLGL